MSDGGQAERKTDETNNSIVRSGAGSYSQAIARIAAAQLCETIGFEGFNESALDSLADIAIRYILDLGRVSNFYANLAGRTESNVFDVAQGLEDLGLPQSFLGDSDNDINCKLSSDSITRIKYFVEISQEVPFAHPVQRFPVVRESKTIPSFLQIGESPSFKHVMPWLPTFPDPHTYIHTPVWNERVLDPHADRIELARQHRKAERSLLTLQQRLLCNGLSTSPDIGRMGNPFLASPLQAEEKHVSLVEMFAPAIESMRDWLDSGSDGENIVPERRVALEFKMDKKVFGELFDLRIRNKAESWFGREVERDDKKRRVEFILRQSLENQQELPQL